MKITNVYGEVMLETPDVQTERYLLAYQLWVEFTVLNQRVAWNRKQSEALYEEFAQLQQKYNYGYAVSDWQKAQNDAIVLSNTMPEQLDFEYLCYNNKLFSFGR